MFLLYNLGRIAAVLVLGTVIYCIFEHFSMDDWFWRLLWLGICLPFVVDMLQGNQAGLLRGEHGMGVCSTLGEDAYVVALFVEDRESRWSEGEIEAYMTNCVGDGISFIESQAKHYGQDLNLGYGYYQENGAAKTVYYDGVIAGNGDIKNDPVRNLNILRKAAGGLGYGSVREMLKSDREATGQKQIAYLVCVNKPGRAYAAPDSRDAFFYDQVEYAVLYAYHPDSEVLTTSAGVAHELLHLFGAEDYYAEGRRNRRRSILAETLCPQDVMFNGSLNLWEKTVGGYTAYTIGWVDKLPEEYRQWNWWR